jgi:hypothetical protein
MATDSKPIAGTDVTATPWLDDLRKLIGTFQLPGVDVTALIEWRRKDMEAIAESKSTRL